MLNFAQGYEDHNVNPLDYEGKHVLILGKFSYLFSTFAVQRMFLVECSNHTFMPQLIGLPVLDESG